jgi:hypothetical protein
MNLSIAGPPVRHEGGGDNMQAIAQDNALTATITAHHVAALLWSGPILRGARLRAFLRWRDRSRS